MADFEYQGVDRSGKRVTGTITAPAEGDVRVSLRQQGVRPTRIAKKRGGETRSGIKRGLTLTLSTQVAQPGLNLKQKILFTRQLQVMISAGIPLVQALDILAEQTIDTGLKQILTDVRDRVNQGSFFWEALSIYPKGFSKIYVSLVRAGESSGSLETVLKRLSRYLEDTDRLRKMVVGALMYPAVVSVVGLVIVVGMLVFIIPKFEAMIAAQGESLPLPTQIVINASHFLGAHFVPLLGGLLVLGFSFYRFIKTPEGKMVFDRFLFSLPLFGDLIQKSSIAAFSRTMQTLLAAGVNLVDAVEICKNTIDSSVVAQSVARIRGEVEVGKTLGAVVSGMSVFPRMAVQMIGVGEATGNLDKMLEKVADFYEAEVESVVNAMGKLIEPIILVVLGGTVAGMLIAMYLPMFKMAGGV
ncbi:MAG: type II secretion system F family protein [Oligoflexia bacterium]